jgi:hypothetical protein
MKLQKYARNKKNPDDIKKVPDEYVATVNEVVYEMVEMEKNEKGDPQLQLYKKLVALEGNLNSTGTSQITDLIKRIEILEAKMKLIEEVEL